MPDELQEVKTLLASSGSLLGSAIQRVSIFRQRHADPFIKKGFLRDVTPSMSCILGDEWTQKVEEEDKLNRVTQKVVKNTNTSTKTKSSFKDKGGSFKKFPGFNKDTPYNRSKGFNNNRGHYRHKSFNSSGHGQAGYSHDSFRSNSKGKEQYQTNKYQKN